MNTEPTLKNLTDPNYGRPRPEQNALLQQLGVPHISSFNYMINDGLSQAVADLQPAEFQLPNKSKVKVKIIGCSISCPLVPDGTVGSKNPVMYPSECRQSARSYVGKLIIRVQYSIDGVEQQIVDKHMGDVPIMLKSNRCHLNMMSPEQLIKHGEHEQEWGGYFIIKGLPRLVRMLLMTRRNYPVAIKRSTWKGRGKFFSDIGVSIRCVTADQTATNNVLHYTTQGSAKLMFSYQKIMYYVPVILVMKCLWNHSDKYIYQRLIEGFEDNLCYTNCMKNMLREIHEEKLHTSDDCKAYIGKMFRIKFFECPPWWTDTEIADFILKRCVLIHLTSLEDKFNMLVFMTQKLFSFANDNCKPEGADCVMMQEIMLGGHLYLQVLKERLHTWLQFIKTIVYRRAAGKLDYEIDPVEFAQIIKVAGLCASTMENLISTGNVKTASGLGLMQTTGLTIIPENINYMRYMSHFKAVHRGSFFQEMRTTEARQLLPDAWGFICPVHTPDGAPCGLLNHLTMNCVVTETADKEKLGKVPDMLADLGMQPIKGPRKDSYKDYYVTQLDGRILGYVHKDIAKELVFKLRLLKIDDAVPKMMEIVWVPIKKFPAQFPGIYLFTGPARMMRPLINLKVQKIEYVGTFEQVYLDVCIKPEEMYKGITTHMELAKTGFLSNLAQLIPMPDCNQSPRNMYQCQMGKQTMGTPCHTWQLQAENKLYRLQTPATPLFRPTHHDNIDLDDFPMGTNAIVAVISYTGYDMEDAMVINKSSFERGFAHGSIYKSEFIELNHANSYFCRDPMNAKLMEYLDTDGLPHIGRKMNDGEPLYSFYNYDLSNYKTVKFSGKEEAYVSNVRLVGDFKISRRPRVACLTFCVSRNPCVGDKFASRAGQKGICSQKWPSEDLPFTESGLVPDIVFNPHGFPSRMTIAMMIEIMAGKSAAVHGLVHDATPFKFTEKNTAIDYFGKLLEAGGYNYYGTETMYSGIDGREMKAQIFFGIVHYQRLRHMVSDKWQVRSTGPIDALTRQPLKGRKRGGGVRFGEMERDAIISHGASFLLQDRLFHCSDRTTVFICTKCNSILSPVTIVTQAADKPQFSESKESCRLCDSGDHIAEIQIPYIFKFFAVQLSSCNINIKIETKKI